MNQPTAAQLSQDSFQHFDSASAYTGDYLISFIDDVTLIQELSDIVLDMSLPE